MRKDGKLKAAILTVLIASMLFVLLADARGVEYADMIITGGVVYTLVPENPRAEAVAISGAWIIAAGNRSEIEKLRGPSTVEIDATGLTVMPGLVDAHAHMTGLGNKLAQIDLVGTGSPEEVRALVLEHAKNADPGAWIEGRGWDQNDWPVREFPTWKDLEGVDAHPVCLRRVDGHAVWVNRRALEVCGIGSETGEPAGGRIIRDAEGEPTGIFVDNAANLITDRIPKMSFEERVKRLKTAAAECARWGLTGVHDAGVGAESLEALEYLEERGELGIRIYAMLDADEADFAERMIRNGVRVGKERMVTLRALKLYADGALGSRGAALIEPYSDEAGHRGLFVRTREDLLAWTRLALENGFQVCTHAIGDAANRMMLDVYEEALRGQERGDRRLRVEHAQVLDKSDIGRFARLGVIASIQPTHATSDMYWAEERLGPERLEGAYAWRALLDSGCVLACGSDFPVEKVNPLLGVYAAVTRTDGKGWPKGGWQPEQRMSIEEAVRGFTVGAAYAGFNDDVKGTIQPNMIADVTILATDIFRCPSAEIPDVAVAYTIVGGRIVYDASAGDGEERE